MSTNRLPPYPWEDYGQWEINDTSTCLHTTSLHNSIHSTSPRHIDENQPQVNLSQPRQPRHTHHSQQSMFDYLPLSYQQRFETKSDDPRNELWGDKFTTKMPNTLRVWYTNPCGLELNPNSTKSHNTFSSLSQKPSRCPFFIYN